MDRPWGHWEFHPSLNERLEKFKKLCLETDPVPEELLDKIRQRQGEGKVIIQIMCKKSKDNKLSSKYRFENKFGAGVAMSGSTSNFQMYSVLRVGPVEF